MHRVTRKKKKIIPFAQVLQTHNNLGKTCQMSWGNKCRWVTYMVGIMFRGTKGGSWWQMCVGDFDCDCDNLPHYP